MKVKCDECNGKGYTGSKYTTYYSCQVCGGVGKTDWVSNITRPKNYQRYHFQNKTKVREGIEKLKKDVIIREMWEERNSKS